MFLIGEEEGIPPAQAQATVGLKIIYFFNLCFLIIYTYRYHIFVGFNYRSLDLLLRRGMTVMIRIPYLQKRKKVMKISNISRFQNLIEILRYFYKMFAKS